jgi:ElaA protein
LVKENYRGQGLGRKLMEKSLKFVLNEMGEKKVRISAQEYLLDFYSGLGFVKESDTYLEDGIPHIEMLYQA